MRLGARVGFSKLEALEWSFEGVDFPVELALPHKVDDFLTIKDRISVVGDFVSKADIQVLSVHAAQGFLPGEAYRNWGIPAIQLADDLGASSVTFHPNQVKRNRLETQALFKKHLQDLQNGFQAQAAVETFGGKRRLLRPDEIVEAGLPMILDTAHLHDDSLILSLIERYHTKMPTVHLSARGESEHHLPIDTFCLQVVKLLERIDWEGSVILEYLPWHHYRISDDLKLIERFLKGEEDIDIPPPDDKYRNDKTCWGYTVRS